MKVHVDCYTDDRGILTPIGVRLDGRSIEVEEILDQWPGSDHWYFKLRSVDGAIYILRYDEREAQWDLTLYRSPRANVIADSVFTA